MGDSLNTPCVPSDGVREVHAFVPAPLAFLAMLPTLITAPFAAMDGGHAGARIGPIVSCAPGLTYFKLASERCFGGVRLIEVLTWSGRRGAVVLGIQKSL